MNNNFEKYIRENLANYEAEVPENAWDNIKTALDKQGSGNSGGNSLLYKGLSIAGLAVAGIGLLYMLSTDSTPDITQTSIDQIEKLAQPEKSTNLPLVVEKVEPEKVISAKVNTAGDEIVENSIPQPEKQIVNSEDEVVKSEKQFLEKIPVDIQHVPAVKSMNSIDDRMLAQENEAAANNKKSNDIATSSSNALISASVNSGYAPLTVEFENKGSGLQQFWDFGNGETAYQNSAKSTFREPGTYTVRLTSSDKLGVETSDIMIVEVKTPSKLYIPNSFSPNGDGLNDVYRAEGMNLDDYTLIIFDNLGNKVFQSKNINESWDGRLGVNSNAEYFIAVVKATGVDGKIYDERVVVRTVQ